MKKYTANCATCGWSDESDTVAERRAATRGHVAETGHLVVVTELRVWVIGLGTVADEFLETDDEPHPP